METISCKQARDKMAEVVNQVTYGHKKYAITRHGNEVAVIISMDEWKSIEKILRKIEEDKDIADAEMAMERIKLNGGIPLDQLKQEFGL